MVLAQGGSGPMRIARIAAYLASLGIGLAGSSAGAEASEGLGSKLPRPQESLPAAESPQWPGGVPVPDLAEALQDLAAATLSGARSGSDQHRRAIDLLELAVAGDPASTAAKVQLADACVDSGNPFAVALAGELYAEALVDHPRTDSLLARLADVCLVLRNDEGAFAWAAQRLAADQGSVRAAAAQLVLIALETGNLGRAAEDLERAGRETQEPPVAKLGRLLAQDAADSVRDVESQRPPLRPAAVRRFHDQRRAAMSDPLLSTGARIAMVQTALREFLAAEPSTTGRDAHAGAAAVRPTGRAFAAIQEHRQRLIALEAAREDEAAGEATEDSDAGGQAIRELRACVVAAELTEPQLRYLHRCLDLVCSAEDLVGLWAAVQRTDAAGGGIPQDGEDVPRWTDLWRPLTDVCQVAAIQEDWRQVRFSLRVLRELTAHPTPVPQLVDTVRAETSDAVAAMKAAWSASREAERELLMARRHASLHRAEETRRQGTSEEAEQAEAQAAEVQQAVGRFRGQMDLHIVLALLCQSAGPPVQPDELETVVGSGMMMQFKTDMATGALRPGAAVWFDRAVQLDAWFNADQHAESLADASADDRESPSSSTAARRHLPAERLGLTALVSVVTEAAACLDPDDFHGPPAGREQTRVAGEAADEVAGEVKRMQEEGIAEAEVRRWLIEHLRRRCRQSFRGSADEVATPADGEGERRTDL